MQIFDVTTSNIPTNLKPFNLCLGFFDGVHIGHQKIINAAKEDGLAVGVLTFDVPPKFACGVVNTLKCINSVDDKAELLEKMGVDYLFVLAFDEALKNTTRLNFVNEIIKPLNPHALYCGLDYRFGRFAEGDPEYLSEFFETHCLPFLEVDGKKVSSSTILEYIENGDIKTVSKLLGHYYKIAGTVVLGNQKGKSIGFPTANLDLDYPYVMPKDGVYMGYGYISGMKKKVIISVGTHPTFKELVKPIIEAYIIDFDGYLYGDYLYIEFVDRIRDIIRYPSLESLAVQIEKDKEIAINSLH